MKAKLGMVYGSMSVRRFRNIAAINSTAFRRQSWAAATFSSSSKVEDTISSQKRISLVLYRQLLRWCNETDKDIPLGPALPPIHFSPPQINADSLKGMIDKNDKHSTIFSPETSVVNKSGIAVHIVPTSHDAKQIVRAVFRMNAATSDEQERRDQVSLAFEWIKNLNELTQQLEEMKKRRMQHGNREGVEFRVGQVVKHKTLAWRGVVMGWRRQTTDENDATGSSRATSLTQKSYESTNVSASEDGDEIAYDIAIDLGDATLLSSAMQQSGLKNVYQSDLTLVDDPDLMRIRTSSELFQRFDPVSQCFVPGDALTYVYPSDIPEKEDHRRSSESYENPSNESAKNVTEGVRSLAEHLRQIILGYTSAPESRKLRLLSGYLDRLTKLSQGDVVPAEERFGGGGSNPNTQIEMKWTLSKLVELAVEMEDILWTRRKTLETDRSIKYSLGEYVQHKKYGFRGVVVGWDPGKLMLPRMYKRIQILSAFSAKRLLSERTRL